MSDAQVLDCKEIILIVVSEGLEVQLFQNIKKKKKKDFGLSDSISISMFS